MHWTKLGRIYIPSANHPKLVTHAANPLPIHLEGDIYRIFFSGRDVQNRSSVGFADVNIASFKIVYDHRKPIFEHSSERSFFSEGVSLGNSYQADGKNYILFMGWQRPSGNHWRGDIGRLVLNSDFSLELKDQSPILSSDPVDPISLSYPWVIREQSGKYRMYYGSTITWDAGNSEMLHVINHAESEHGRDWKRLGLSIPYKVGVAQAFSHPSVIYSPEEGYQMWFSYRSGANDKYRIGYAQGSDGKNWELRNDEAGIDVSESGWDSEMIEYPFVFDHKGQRFMLYNGNGYGKTGFGLAIFE